MLLSVALLAGCYEKPVVQSSSIGGRDYTADLGKCTVVASQFSPEEKAVGTGLLGGFMAAGIGLLAGGVMGAIIGGNVGALASGGLAYRQEAKVQNEVLRACLEGYGYELQQQAMK